MASVPSPEDRPSVSRPSRARDGRTSLYSFLDGRLTRRRAVGAGLAVGAAAWLGAAAGPTTALAASRPGRMIVRRSALSPGTIVGPLPAPHRFDLLGAPVNALAGAGIEVRARTRGRRWSSWQGLSPHDGHAPDGRRAAMSDPVWFGDADEIQLRARRRPSRDLRLDLVAVASGTKRQGARATARAVASGGVLGEARARSRSAGQATPRVTAPTIIPRSAWAGGLNPKSGPQMGQVQLAFVHHTVNGNGYGPEASAAIVRAIAEYHMKSNGWNDIGYNFLVDRYGQVFEGRAGGIEQPVIGAQAVGWNSVSTGIAIIGTFEGEPAPDAAINAVAALISWKLPLHGAPTAGTVSLVSSGGAGNRWPGGQHVDLNRISGHQDGCSTDCPGTALYAQLDTIRGRVGTVPVSAPVAKKALTIVVPSTAVAYGAQLTVSGRFTVGGNGAANVDVVIEKKSPTGRWVPLTRTQTDADGGWSTTLTWRAASAVRARAAGITSKTATAGLDPSLSLRQPSRRVRRGGTLMVRGGGRGVPDVSVVVRRKQGTRYVVSSRKTLKLRRGAFNGRVPVRGRGINRVTVEAKSAGHRYESVRRYVRAVG
jgi:hypothetical protein